MISNLNSLTYGPLVFQQEIPSTVLKLVVPGSRPLFSEGKYGSILCQEMNAGGIRIFHNTYNIKEDIAIDFDISIPHLQVHVAIRNDNLVDLDDIGSVHFKEGQFNLLHSSQVKGTIYLERGKEYRTMDIFYPDNELQEVYPYLPFVGEYVEIRTSRHQALFFDNQRWIHSQVTGIFERILHCTLQERHRQLYFNLKAKELLLLLVTHEFPETIHRNGLNSRAVESINEAKYIIDTRFGEHITLQGIAKQVGMNEVKLRHGFKMMFGDGVFDYLLKTRMENAKTWLIESDKPIKAIAQLTGYSTKQSFLTAFKNFFNDTPGSFRKN